MDEVQKFISENQHQFGYIMQEASRQWIAKDPIGALTVGQCVGTIKANGAYIQLLDKVERYEKALCQIVFAGTKEMKTEIARDAVPFFNKK
ncbi:hypothetical protein [Cytobacillus oceanisediminis]|uniref:hypothetical protein n=1 Tax=Cytobacillus oceanisediminis TaxID=665099 RepID=UPI00207970F7|nr:hypothetical protein [Cytobacillus oceanisediminis]USK43551.1 hypothetical protein LIT27_23670 [Cytobacillus oceanisediminis]USK43742.1 hypothetical protein LIT27_24710 [Cytobacillus oceanisediminis]